MLWIDGVSVNINQCLHACNANVRDESTRPLNLPTKHHSQIPINKPQDIANRGSPNEIFTYVAVAV